MAYWKRKTSGNSDDINITPIANSQQLIEKENGPELAAISEQESRRILERTSSFEYWWEDYPSTSICQFHTLPLSSARKKSTSITDDGPSRMNAASWPNTIDKYAEYGTSTFG